MLFTCPVCGKKLMRNEKEAWCENNHHFDYAKSGYLNLLISAKKVHGDDADMVKARTAFLNSGHYGFLKDRLKELAGHSEVLVDLGCGEGYYTAAFEADEKAGFDLSKAALKHAARNDRTSSYAAASIFRLPLADACADTVVTCFAPHAKDEIQRILKPGGRFIFVTPGRYHLFEMKKAVYETPYENKEEDLDTDLQLVHSETIENTFACTQEELENLFAMTPYFWKTSAKDHAKLQSISKLDVTAQFVIRIYRKDS